MKAHDLKSKVLVPPNFNEALANDLCSWNDHAIDGESAGGFVEIVAITEFQADSDKAGKIVNPNAVMAIIKDSATVTRMKMPL